jgi:ubiquitin-activating enzyme E1 C
MTSQQPSTRNLLERDGPLAQEDFEASEDNYEVLGNDCPILIVGAGGLGCELLKNAALSGFKDITLIDLDTIDISNLNRQFLFRKGDEGKYKAVCAAEKIMEIVPDCKVTAYHRPIQEFSRDFYKDFTVIIAGLDNQGAREWLMRTALDLVRYDEDGDIDDSTVIPVIDGGTEGFAGQTRVFVPRKSSCFICQKQSDVKRADTHMCTPAVNPRIPEHCIQYALLFRWPNLMAIESPEEYKLFEPTETRTENPDPVTLDKDDAVHMTWIYNQALEWGAKHKIAGVTYSLTMQVVKNIIPAIASTNAIVAAQCMMEAYKWLSYTAPVLNNYFFYNGSASVGVHGNTFKYNADPTCDACSKPKLYTLPGTTLLSDLFDKIVADNESCFKEIRIAFRGDRIIYSKLNNSNADAKSKPLSEVRVCVGMCLIMLL